MFIFYGTIQTNTINLGGEMPDDTLIDLTKNNPEQNTDVSSNQPVGLKKTIEPISVLPVLTPKKSKWWVWVLVAIVIIGLGGVGYWYYKTQMISGKADLAKYQKGPDLPIEQKDVMPAFNYFFDENILIYQKTDLNIYGSYYDFENKQSKILDTFGGQLISLSPDGKNCILYYSESPKEDKNDSSEIKSIKEKLKNAKNSFYLANLADNIAYDLGPNLSNFIWAGENVYFIRNGNELLTYDFRLANYQAPVYQGETTIYYKVSDLKYPIISATSRPDSSLIYFVSINSNSNQPELASFDTSNRKFTKIMDTTANGIIFSYSGKYYVLVNGFEKKLAIYDSLTNQKISEIDNTEITPLKIAWGYDDDFNEKYLYYFTKEKIYSNKIDKNMQIPLENYYSNLVKYELDTKKTAIIIKGVEKNIINPINLEIDNLNRIILFSTAQNNNIYKVGLK